RLGASFGPRRHVHDIRRGRQRRRVASPHVRRYFRKAWRRAAKAAGIHGLLFHDLRRSAARNLIRSGVPEQVVMDLGGWRARSVLARYNVTSARDLADALERVTRYVAERSAETPKVEPL